MFIAHLITENEEKVKTFAYKKWKTLEKNLRGNYADLIVVDGFQNYQECPKKLMDTFLLVIAPTEGAILFMGDRQIEN